MFANLQAEKDRARYKEAMKTYVPPKGTESASGKGKKGKKKDPNEPKRAMTSFMHFSNEMRAKLKEENPSLSFGDLVSIKYFRNLPFDVCK